LLGKHYTTLTTHPDLFVLVVFQIRASCLLPGAELRTEILLPIPPSSWANRREPPGPTCYLRHSLANVLPGLASNQNCKNFVQLPPNWLQSESKESHLVSSSPVTSFVVLFV
jgi:hypothetical protein